ncbi:hypothetical protein G3T36_18470 [Diaminobutyricibacter tongyongensis]|uniref:Uncharacterized protein n=1 Tax=Leifsonia tongyongensis TaxID=1268043 RepID=A0A6L9Y2U8_9MICO|nr:hypothetical protein [Diaminobutyricibacter tongyongensis]NEN07845.1 hypothetical protein [Diaminobutyricibacter tongyongensis]
MTDDDNLIEPVPVVLLPPNWDRRGDVTIPLRGRYVVQTEASRYHLDFETGYLTRFRGEHDSEDPFVPPASHMRFDGESLKILRVLLLKIGWPMVVDVQRLGDPTVVAFTRRTTTFVSAITPSVGTL